MQRTRLRCPKQIMSSPATTATFAEGSSANSTNLDAPSYRTELRLALDVDAQAPPLPPTAIKFPFEDTDRLDPNSFRPFSRDAPIPLTAKSIFTCSQSQSALF